MGFFSSGVVFTDLDGTLLDHDSYSWEAARPALDELRACGIPLVIVTSKTRIEVEELRTQLDLRGENITENGSRSRSYEWICQQLREASAATGVAVRGFHEMTPQEISTQAGLPVPAAQSAARRENSEPFQILAESRTQYLLRELERRGLNWTRGGRFHHVFESGGKGEAVRRILDQNPTAASLGLGDAPNDISFLREVGEAVIVRSPRSDEMSAALPQAAVTEWPGPRGWNEAVLSFLRRREASGHLR